MAEITQPCGCQIRTNGKRSEVEEIRKRHEDEYSQETTSWPMHQLKEDRADLLQYIDFIELDASECRFNELNDKITQLGASLSSAMGKQDAQDAELIARQQRIADLEGQLADKIKLLNELHANGDLRDQTQREMDLSSQLEKVEEERDTLQNWKTALTQPLFDRIRELEAANASLTAERDDLKRQLEIAESHINGFAENAAYWQEIERLKK